MAHRGGARALHRRPRGRSRIRAVSGQGRREASGREDRRRQRGIRRTAGVRRVGDPPRIVGRPGRRAGRVRRLRRSLERRALARRFHRGVGPVCEEGLDLQRPGCARAHFRAGGSILPPHGRAARRKDVPGYRARFRRRHHGDRTGSQGGRIRHRGAGRQLACGARDVSRRRSGTYSPKAGAWPRTHSPSATPPSLTSGGI